MLKTDLKQNQHKNAIQFISYNSDATNTIINRTETVITEADSDITPTSKIKYCLLFIWLNYRLDNVEKNKTSLNSKDRTIYRGLGTQEFVNNILSKLIVWNSLHSDADIYLGYDRRTTDDISIENTKTILREYTYIKLIDLTTIIDDEFIVKFKSFFDKYISYEKAIEAQKLCDYNSCDLPHKPSQNNANISFDNFLNAEYIRNTILGNEEDETTKNISPLYFRVDMWRLLLTLHLTHTKYKYTHIVYSDIDVDPTQHNLKSKEVLFDEKTLLWLDDVGFVTGTKSFTHRTENPNIRNFYWYENGFHILKCNNNNAYISILYVCIYMNIVRFIFYMAGLYFKKKSGTHCLKDIFEQIVFESYPQLFIYLNYMHDNITLYKKINDGMMQYIKLNNTTDIIPLLGINCASMKAMPKCNCEYLHFKRNDKYKTFIVNQIIPKHVNTVPTRFKAYINKVINNFDQKLNDLEIPTKQVKLGASTVVQINCNNKAQSLAE